MSHIPGPWYGYQDTNIANVGEVYDGPLRKEGGTYFVPAGTQLIAQVANVGSLEGQRANTQLIAAAPELLEACKDALNALQHHGHYGDTSILAGAIAKAESN